MARQFATYFTARQVWRSCDVVEVGTFTTERAAMRAGLQSAVHHPDWNPHNPHTLPWQRVPWGLVAKTAFGRYDIREIAADRESLIVP